MPLIDGKVPYDVFVERTDPKVVRHQLDVGNMVMGGGDPFAYLQRYRDRYWSFHLKDVVADRSRDRKSTRLNSSHSQISYAVFCLKKKKNKSTKRVLTLS